MLDALAFDTNSFASSYSSIKEKHTYNKMKIREELAEANNCIAIGDSSCYADMVAVPKDFPDVVIKICSGTDSFIHYAHHCISGKIAGPHIPKFFSETEIAPGVWLFVMERLDRSLTDHEWNMTVDRSISWWSNPPKRGKYANVCRTLMEDKKKIEEAMNSDPELYWCFDLHRGNFMLRKDGTIVYLDPVS